MIVYPPQIIKAYKQPNVRVYSVELTPKYVIAYLVIKNKYKIKIAIRQQGQSYALLGVDGHPGNVNLNWLEADYKTALYVFLNETYQKALLK